jgi:hypothetical protein
MVFIEYCWNDQTKKDKRVEHKVRNLQKSRNLEEDRSAPEIYNGIET